MSESEGKSQHNPESGETLIRPGWIILSRGIFPEGSLGYDLYTEKLNGRNRPGAIFDKKLNDLLLLQRGSEITKRFTNYNIQTVKDVLSLPESNLGNFAYQKGMQARIKSSLQKYLELLVIPPHGRLVEGLQQKKQYPIPMEREQELIDFVDNKVNELEPEIYKRFSRDRFGLDDGIYKTIPQIRRFYGGPQKATALDNTIKHHGIVNQLYGYNSTPEESVAREAFGAVFYKELPLEMRNRSIDLSSLSEPTKEELIKIHRVFGINGRYSTDKAIDVNELLLIDLQDAGVAAEAQEEISNSVKDYYNLHFRKPTT